MCPHSSDVAFAPHFSLPARQPTPSNGFSDGFLFFYQSCRKSQQLRVERFIMTSTDVCVILELCLEFLKMLIFRLCEDV